MHFVDTQDDLALPQKPFKVVACLPVYGRLPLLKHTIERLYNKNGACKVICSGDGAEEKNLCESLGAIWVPSQNRPLGLKWNRAFRAAKEFSPDAVVYVGSSDFLSENWFRVMEPHIKAKEFAGVAGCHFVDVADSLRGVFWKGYRATTLHRDRSNETIGIGRMLSAGLMDKINWSPFLDTYNNSLDWSMKEKCRRVGVDDFMVEDNTIRAVSISTNRWENKHDFSKHWADPQANIQIDADDFADKYFPELKMI